MLTMVAGTGDSGTELVLSHFLDVSLNWDGRMRSGGRWEPRYSVSYCRAAAAAKVGLQL